MNQIAVKALEVGYEEKIIVRGMNLDIQAGQITTLIGPNGCGKSTLLKAITRILKAKQGTVTLKGVDTGKIPTKELARQISVLSQHQVTPADIVVEDLVAYGRMPYQKWYEGESARDREVVEWAMESARVLSMRKRKVASLSGGERQRAWIAAALAQEPEFLFLDEPTTYLDIAHQIEIMELVKQLKRDLHIAIVMVLHDISQAMEVSDQVIVMRAGEKIIQGPPEQVITEALIEEVYRVKSRILTLPGKARPIITYDCLLQPAS